MNTSPTVVSLDPEESPPDDESKQQISTEQSKIVFVVDENYEIEYPLEFIKTFKKVSKLFEGIDETIPNESFKIDLSAYIDRSNILPILHCLLTGTFTPLSNKYNYSLVEKVADFLVIDKSITKQIVLDNQRLFWENLNGVDMEIRRTEKQIRHYLNLKNIDVGDVDQQFIPLTIYNQHFRDATPKLNYKKWHITRTFSPAEAVAPVTHYFNDDLISNPQRHNQLISILRKWNGKLVAAGKFIADSDYSDIDLFLVTRDENEAKTIIEDVHNSIELPFTPKHVIIRAENSITITRLFKNRKIRIMLRLYNSVAQILVNCDIDVLCCAYDGNTFYCNERFLRAQINREIVVDPEYQSKQYGFHLKEMYQRHRINIAFIGYDKSRQAVDIRSEYKTNDKRNGLALTLAQFNSKLIDYGFDIIRNYDVFTIMRLAVNKATGVLKKTNMDHNHKKLIDDVKSSGLFCKGEFKIIGEHFADPEFLSIYYPDEGGFIIDPEYVSIEIELEDVAPNYLKLYWFENEDLLKKFSTVTKTLKDHDIKMQFKLYTDTEFLYGRESKSPLLSKYLDWPVDFDLEFKINHFSDTFKLDEQKINNWFLDLYAFD